MRFVALAAVLALLIGATAVAAARPRAQAAPRPLLVFVHGRGHLDRDSAAVRVEWDRSLRMGARELEVGPLFDARDVRLVWYADVLDPRSEEGCTRTGEPAAPRSETNEASPWTGARMLLSAVAEALEEPDGRREARGLVGDLLYLADPWKRCGVERRLARVLDEARAQRRPVVLVTHSLGAAVTYRHLRARGTSTADVRRWVTLGAPLGDRDLRGLLLGDADATHALRVPAAVRSWINIIRDGDPFASPVAAQVQKSTALVRDLVRSRVSGDAHDLASYLKDPISARAIVWAWCDAFPKGSAPVGCAAVREDVK